MPNSYVMVMVDGKNFSSLVKEKFEKPFDNKFVDMMNETMLYMLQNIQGALFGFCQSDEITIVLADNENGEPKSSFFEYRLCKINSICAALATSKFNNLAMKLKLQGIPNEASSSDVKAMALDTVENIDLYQFDCKAWNVPSANDAYAYLLWRQNDCIRNSKQQYAQSFFRHQDLENKNTDEQIQMVFYHFGEDWNSLTSGLKYGRIAWRKDMEMYSEQYGKFTRKKWFLQPAVPFEENLKEGIISTLTGK